MEPIFLTLAEVLEIHDLQLEAHGGIQGIRDKGLLESAVMMPQSSFGGEFLHKTLFEMSAAYAFHISENQPFLDGNKRTALVSALVFLDVNGFIVIDEEMKLYDAMISIAKKQMNKSNLAQLLENLTHK